MPSLPGLSRHSMARESVVNRVILVVSSRTFQCKWRQRLEELKPKLIIVTRGGKL